MNEFNFELVKVTEDKVFIVFKYFKTWMDLREFYSYIKKIFLDKTIIIMYENNWKELNTAMSLDSFCLIVEMKEYSGEIPDEKEITGICNDFVFKI